jgi:carbonic anhydrase
MRSFVSAALLALGASAATVDYTQNGANWPDLCATGREQSPIDLTDAATTSENIGISLYGYRDYDGNMSLSNKGYTLQVDMPTNEYNGKMMRTFDDETQSLFKLVQFHVHAPSENTIDGSTLDMEMHFVHLYDDTDGLAAVLGVFFDRVKGGNADNLFLDQWLEKGIPSSGNSSTLSDQFDLNINGFLQSLDTTNFWSFDGSLTTPPCTEGVKWAVLKDIQPISDRQLKLMADLWANDSNFAAGKGNNRVTQPLHGRTVHQYGEVADPLIEKGKAAVAVLAVLFVLSLLGLIALGLIVFLKPEWLERKKSNSNSAAANTA